MLGYLGLTTTDNTDPFNAMRAHFIEALSHKKLNSGHKQQAADGENTLTLRVSVTNR